MEQAIQINLECFRCIVFLYFVVYLKILTAEFRRTVNTNVLVLFVVIELFTKNVVGGSIRMNLIDR